MSEGPNRQGRVSPCVGDGFCLEALRPFLEDGQVVPVIDRTYALADVPAAMRHLEAGLARGKITITVQPHSAELDNQRGGTAA